MSDYRASRTSGRTIRACGDRRAAWPTSEPRRAVFLDRDGTLIVDRPYSADPNTIELLPGVAEGLSVLQEAGYLLIVVTNQSGIARGFFDESALGRMHERLDSILADSGVNVAAYYYCPHHVEGTNRALAVPCDCRKPAPGMLFRAASDWAIDLGRSWLIGNTPTDLEAARAAGCRALLVGTSETSSAYPRFDSLLDAARVIIEADGHGRLREAARPRSARQG